MTTQIAVQYKYVPLISANTVTFKATDNSIKDCALVYLNRTNYFAIGRHFRNITVSPISPNDVHLWRNKDKVISQFALGFLELGPEPTLYLEKSVLCDRIDNITCGQRKKVQLWNSETQQTDELPQVENLKALDESHYRSLSSICELAFTDLAVFSSFNTTPPPYGDSEGKELRLDRHPQYYVKLEPPPTECEFDANCCSAVIAPLCSFL